MSDFLLPLLSQLLPVIAGAIAAATFQYVKHASDTLDAAPAWLKQIIVVVLAAVLAWLGSVLGVQIPTDVHAIDPTIWTGIISGALALALHAVKKGDSAPAA